MIIVHNSLVCILEGSGAEELEVSKHKEMMSQTPWLYSAYNPSIQEAVAGKSLVQSQLWLCSEAGPGRTFLSQSKQTDKQTNQSW